MFIDEAGNGQNDRGKAISCEWILIFDNLLLPYTSNFRSIHEIPRAFIVCYSFRLIIYNEFMCKELHLPLRY